MRFEQNLRSSAVVGEADFCAVMRESVSTHSLQRGVRCHGGNGTASAVLSYHVETADSVSASSSASNTPLKQGVMKVVERG